MKMKKAFFVWSDDNLAPVILSDGCECRGKVPSKKELIELLNVLARMLDLAPRQRSDINNYVTDYNRHRQVGK